MLSRISGISSSFVQSISNKIRPFLGNELEAPLGGRTVAPYIPPVPSLQNTGKELSDFDIFCLEMLQARPYLEALWVLGLPDSSPLDLNWIAQAPFSFATRDCLHASPQAFLPLSIQSPHPTHPIRPWTSVEAKQNPLNVEITCSDYALLTPQEMLRVKNGDLLM